MATRRISPRALLGLPDPQESKIGDIELRDLYENFVKQLDVVAGGRVILSNPYAFDVSTHGISASVKKWFAFIAETDRKKLLLLSLLCRPFDASFIRDRWRQKTRKGNTFTFFADPCSASLTEKASAIPYGLDSLRGRRQALAEPTLKLLVDQIPKLTQIETLSSEFVQQQPGNCAFQSWQVAKWSEGWAVVYGVADAGSEGSPFPRLLGFCILDQPERNFIKLLQEGKQRFDEGFYNTYGTVESSWKDANEALEIDED